MKRNEGEVGNLI